jgi:hypothetical protein
MEAYGIRTIRRHYRIVPEVGDPSVGEGDFDFAFRPPFDRKAREIEAMKKALLLVVWKPTARGFCYANVNVLYGGMVKLLRTYEHLENAILHLGHALLWFAT